MSRTARYKLQYVISLGILMVVAGVAAWSLRSQPLALLGVAVLFLIPGRVSGLVWRDLYRGRRLLEAGQLEASLLCSQRFVESIRERPRLRGLWWLAFAVYTRDSKAMALNNLGAAQLELGSFDEAESSFREALAADPQYPIPHYNLAVLAEVRGDSPAAREHAAEAVLLGYERAASDRVIQAAGALLARIWRMATGCGHPG